MSREPASHEPASAPTEPASENLALLEGYYEGERVAAYDAKRLSQESWHAEQRTLDGFLDQIAFPPGSVVLDVPVGTGRFLDTFAKRGFRVVGIDVSSDMVAESIRKAEELGLGDADIRVGDATGLDLPDRSADLVVSVRFLVHLEFDVLQKVLRELARVSSRYVLTHIRIAVPEGLGGVWRRARRATERWVKSALGKTREVKVSKVADKAATVHGEARIRQAFAACGLRLVSEEVVNRTKRGYESRMYLLESLAAQPDE
jgi:ubiquinone/menaquinone biosynthesis C-methylase UbiE